MKTCERINEKLSGYIDRELTQQEMQQVSAHIENCEKCKSTYDELVTLKKKMGRIKLPRIEEEEIMQVMNDRTSNTLQNIGWLVISISLVGLVLMHWISFWQEESISTLTKIFWTLLEAGGLLLLFGVLRQRLIARKTDRYKDVQL